MKHLRYNQNLSKPKQCPASVSRLFYAPILSIRPYFVTRFIKSLGVLGSGNAPAVLGSESTPTFTGVLNLNSKEAHHA